MRVPLYRLLAGSDHFYTTSETERDNAVSQYGYHIEGIACYVEDSAVDNSRLLALRDEISARVIGHIVAVQLAAALKTKPGSNLNNPTQFQAVMDEIGAGVPVDEAMAAIMRVVDKLLAAAMAAHTP